MGLMARPFAIGDHFPDDLWMLHYPARGKYFCIRPSEQVNALVCLSTRRPAELFSEALSDRPTFAEGCVPRRVSFEKARQIAKARESVQALVLVDYPQNLRFHYVR